MKRWASILIIIFLLVSLAGCGAAQTASNNPSETKETSNSLIIATQQDAKTLDPHLGTDIDSANIYYEKIYEGLLCQNENMEIVPGLATEWKKINETTWEFKLRQGVKFHDGTPFNAAAVKKNIDRLLSKDTASGRADLFKMVKEVKPIDDYTVQVITEYPFAPILASFAHYVGGMISPKAIDDYGKKLGQNPAGTGPFKLESWKPGQEVVLARNNDYWGEKSKIAKVIFKIIPESSTRLAMVQTGEAQIARQMKISDIDQINKSSTMTLLRSPALATEYMGFNNQKKPLNDVKVRQAISYAIDRDVIMKGIFDNIGNKGEGPMSPKVWGYDSSIKGYPYDPTKAKELLSEAGYSKGFKLLLTTDDKKERKKLAEVVQAQLKGIGIEVEIQVMEANAMYKLLEKPETAPDMFIKGWSNMTGDADFNQYFLFNSKSFGAPGNRQFYSNPQVDKLLDQARSESDSAKRKSLYLEAQKVEMSDAAILPVWYGDLLLAGSKKVQGIWMHPADIIMLNQVSFSN